MSDELAISTCVSGDCTKTIVNLSYNQVTEAVMEYILKRGYTLDSKASSRRLFYKNDHTGDYTFTVEREHELPASAHVPVLTKGEML